MCTLVALTAVAVVSVPLRPQHRLRRTVARQCPCTCCFPIQRGAETKIAWSVVLLVCGIVTYVAALQRHGTVDAVGAGDRGPRQSAGRRAVALRRRRRHVGVRVERRHSRRDDSTRCAAHRAGTDRHDRNWSSRLPCRPRLSTRRRSRRSERWSSRTPARTSRHASTAAC